MSAARAAASRGRVARAAPDGYTLSVGSGDQFVVNAAIYPLQYDVVKDFEPIGLLISGPNLIVSKNAVPASNLKELVAWMKANEANAAAAHNGAGGVLHLCGIELQRIAGTNFPFIPYRGCARAARRRRRGRIDVMCTSPASSLRHGAQRPGAGLCHHEQQAPGLRAGDPDGRRGRISAISHVGLGRPVRAQSHAERCDREAQCRRERGAR
jgi:tripartite-type tricarboxylate transporter receptor subunit TctC